MKIGILENLPDGGAKRVLLEQVKRLSDSHELFYIRFNKKTSFNVSEWVDGVQDFELTEPSQSGLRRMENELNLMVGWKKVYRRAAKYFDDNDVDVVLVHPDYYTQAPMGLMYLNQPSVYYAEEWLRIVYEPELSPINSENKLKVSYEKLRRKMVKKIDKNSVNAADAVVVNSNFTKNNFLLGYDKESEVIYPGVDNSKFTINNSANRKYFLFVGAKVDVNGYELIEEFQDKSELPIKFKFVTPQKNKLRLTDEEIVETYQNAVATLCLGKGEPFGLTAIESMACGTPVIGVNEGGYKETIVDGVTGILTSRDLTSFSKALLKMASDKSTWNSMSKKSVQHIEAKFSWEKHIEQLELVLQRIVE